MVETTASSESAVLPEELILEILYRVPVRSLLQFRCVCKSWKTLISHPQFAKAHVATATKATHQRLVIPLVDDPCKIESYSVQSLFQKPSTPEGSCFVMGDKYRILGSCNGLLCLLNVHKHFVALWNPSIRITSKAFAFAFPTAISLYNSITYQGLGYDHVNDKYKLLVVAIDHHETVTKVYTFGANSWKVIQNLPCRPNRFQAKFVSGTGTLNWIARTSDGGRWMVLSLDLVTETYGEVLLPGGDGDHVSIPELVLLSNSLLCVSFFDSKKDHWVVWQMKEYGVPNSWTKVMSIPHFNQGVCNWNGFSITPHSLVPLCISENGIILFRTTFSKLVVYNPKDGSLACPGIRGDYWLNMHTYHQSLVSPRC